MSTKIYLRRIPSKQEQQIIVELAKEGKIFGIDGTVESFLKSISKDEEIPIAHKVILKIVLIILKI